MSLSRASDEGVQFLSDVVFTQFEKVEDYLVRNAGNADAFRVRTPEGETALHLAAGSHLEIGMLQTLLSQDGFPINELNAQGETALHAAVKTKRYINVLTLLAEPGLDVDHRCDAAKTALELANELGLTRLVELFESMRIDQASSSTKELSIEDYLHAAKYNKVSIVKQFLDQYKGIFAYLNATDADGNTALHIAVAAGSVEVAVLLLAEKGINANAYNLLGKMPLHLAIGGNHFPLVNRLLAKKFISISKDGKGRLPFALSSSASIKHLLNKWLETTRDNDSLESLFASLVLGSDEVVSFINMNEGDMTALHVTNAEGLTPLHLAAIKNEFWVIIQFIGAGSNPNVIDRGGRTMLHAAVYAHQSDMVLCLVDMDRVNVAQCDAAGNTAADYAELFNISDINKIFNPSTEPFSDEVVCEVVDPLENSELDDLYGAILQKDLPGVEAYIEKNRDDWVAMNCFFDNGLSPLMEAAACGHADIVKALLKVKEVDVDLKNHVNMSARQLAELGGHFKLAFLIGSRESISHEMKGRLNSHATLFRDFIQKTRSYGSDLLHESDLFRNPKL